MTTSSPQPPVPAQPAPDPHRPAHATDAWLNRLIIASTIFGTAASVITYAVIDRWPPAVNTNLFAAVGLLGALSGFLALCAGTRLALRDFQNGDPR